MNHLDALRYLSRCWGFVSALVFIGAVAVVLPACDHSSSTPAVAPASQPAAKVVTMRGTITGLPTADSPHRLMIHNEGIKQMMEMTMAYSADPALSLTGLAVGDKVSFDWSEDDDRVMQIKKLPADTVLGFEKSAARAMTKP